MGLAMLPWPFFSKFQNVDPSAIEQKGSQKLQREDKI
jgi:hypothetical protein